MRGERNLHRNAQIAQRFRQGVPLRDIAAEFGLTVGAVSSWLTANGMRRHAPHCRITAADRARVAELRKRGWTFRRISETVGLSVRVVWKIAANEGLHGARTSPLRDILHPDKAERIAPTEPVFPPTDDFELTPRHRARLEEVRRARWKEWYDRFGRFEKEKKG